MPFNLIQLKKSAGKVVNCCRGSDAILYIVQISFGENLSYSFLKLCLQPIMICQDIFWLQCQFLIFLSVTTLISQLHPCHFVHNFCKVKDHSK